MSPHATTVNDVLASMVDVTVALARHTYLNSIDAFPRFEEHDKRAQQIASESGQLSKTVMFGSEYVQGTFRISRSRLSGTMNEIELTIKKNNKVATRARRKFRAPPLHKINPTKDEKLESLDRVLSVMMVEIKRALE